MCARPCSAARSAHSARRAVTSSTRTIRPICASPPSPACATGNDHIGRALRRGSLYVRETSFDDLPFGLHGPGEIVGWSQVLFDTELLMALNTHSAETRRAAVTVDANLHPPGTDLRVLYDSRWSDDELRNPPADQTVTVHEEADDRAVVQLELPPSGMVILG